MLRYLQLLTIYLVISIVASDDFRYGLKLIHEGESPVLDVIAVHGLDGHWKESFTAADGTFWLEDLLPHELPNSRIFSFAYDSRSRGHDVLSTSSIEDHGRDLLATLATEREDSQTESRPIIFLAHSLGGIVVKSTLLQSDSARVNHLERYRSVKLSTNAVFFLGTPHQGGQGVSLGRIMARIVSFAMYTSPLILNHLEEHSEWLEELQRRYNAISRDFENIFFFETYPMHVPVFGHIHIVPRYSAVIQGAVDSEEVSMAADHGTIVKFSSAVDPNFQKISKRLRRLSKQAAARIRHDWQRSNIESGAGPTSKSASNVKTIVPIDPAEFQVEFSVNHFRNSKFTGRTSVIKKVDTMLQARTDANETGIVVLHGPGGIGKTQVVVEYAYRRASHFSSVFWLDASTEQKLLLGIDHAILRLIQNYETHGFVDTPRYGILVNATANIKSAAVFHDTGNHSTTETPRMTPLEVFHWWLKISSNCKWLLVLDNFDDPHAFDIRRYIPITFCGNIMITSRRTDVALVWNAIEVQEMDDDEAVELLHRIANVKHDMNSSDYSYALKLAKAMGNFPLAISQAGAFMSIHRRSDPMKNYFELYEKQPKALLSQIDIQAALEYRNESVLTTREISFRAVSQEQPDAAHLLVLSSFLSPDDIWEELLAQGADRFSDAATLTKAVHTLLSYSLLRRKANGLSMHPLVHLWARIRLDVSQQRQMTHEAAVVLLKAKKHAEKSLTLALFEPRALPHLEAVLLNDMRLTKPDWLTTTPEIRIPESTHEFRLLKALTRPINGWYLWTRSILEEAIVFLYQLFMRQPTAGLCTWEVLYRLGLINVHQSASGTYRLYAWTLAQSLSIFPAKHPKILTIAGNYASELVYRNISRAGEWFSWLEEARTEVQGLNHPATMGALIGRARVARRNFDYDLAIELTSMAVFQRERKLGPDDFLTINALDFLIEALCEAGRPMECTSWSLEAIKRRKRSDSTYANNPCDIARSITKVAGIYEQQDDFQTSGSLLTEAYDSYTTQTLRCFSDYDYFSFMERLLSTGNGFTRKGDFPMAVALHEKASELFMLREFPWMYPTHVHGNLLHSYLKAGQFSKVVQLLHKYLTLMAELHQGTWNDENYNLFQDNVLYLNDCGILDEPELRAEVLEAFQRAWRECTAGLRCADEILARTIAEAYLKDQKPDQGADWLRICAALDYQFLPEVLQVRVLVQLADDAWQGEDDATHLELLKRLDDVLDDIYPYGSNEQIEIELNGLATSLAINKAETAVDWLQRLHSYCLCPQGMASRTQNNIEESHELGDDRAAKSWGHAKALFEDDQSTKCPRCTTNCAFERCDICAAA